MIFRKCLGGDQRKEDAACVEERFLYALICWGFMDEKAWEETLKQTINDLKSIKNEEDAFKKRIAAEEDEVKRLLLQVLQVQKETQRMLIGISLALGALGEKK